MVYYDDDPIQLQAEYEEYLAESDTTCVQIGILIRRVKAVLEQTEDDSSIRNCDAALERLREQYTEIMYIQRYTVEKVSKKCLFSLRNRVREVREENEEFLQELTTVVERLEGRESPQSSDIEHFRIICRSHALPGQVKITITRDSLFQDSFQQIMQLQPFDLRRKLSITFLGEAGVDYGGLAREWYIRMSHELVNPMHSLFEYASETNYNLQIKPASSVNPDHLMYFRFVGRFMATALLHDQFIDTSFAVPFYKKMLNKELSIDDLQSVDQVFYNSLTYVRDNNLEEVELDLFFAQDFEVAGKVTQHELKEGGADIKVREENKMEYIKLMTQWRIYRGVEEQAKAILDGFNQVVPLDWLKCFDERQLELMLCGKQEIDVEDWEKNTICNQNADSSSQLLEWFWKFVRELDNEKRRKLLQFVTGTCRLPVGGFSELKGHDGPERFRIVTYGEETSLPTSHTCFNLLDLPLYNSYEQLVEKVTIAIEETEGFGKV